MQKETSSVEKLIEETENIIKIRIKKNSMKIDESNWYWEHWNCGNKVNFCIFWVPIEPTTHQQLLFQTKSNWVIGPGSAPPASFTQK